MPFTPYHFGPGLLLKCAAPTRFSFLSYALVQVTIDLESGYFLFSHQPPYHRALHTFVVGGVVGALVGVASGAIAPKFARASTPPVRPLLAAEWAPRPALVGGVIGGTLHSFLDGIMHADIRPFRPLTGANPLYHVIPVSTLHLICLAAGFIGAIVLALRLDRDKLA